MTDDTCGEVSKVADTLSAVDLLSGHKVVQVDLLRLKGDEVTFLLATGKLKWIKSLRSDTSGVYATRVIIESDQGFLDVYNVDFEALALAQSNTHRTLGDDAYLLAANLQSIKIDLPFDFYIGEPLEETINIRSCKRVRSNTVDI